MQTTSAIGQQWKLPTSTDVSTTGLAQSQLARITSLGLDVSSVAASEYPSAFARQCTDPEYCQTLREACED
jgi:hypothetical protein